MVKSRTTRMFVAAIAILLLLMFGGLVASMFAGGSAGGTLASGRSVMTFSDSIALSSTLSSDTATIKTSGKTIVVKPNCLVVDGRTVADIDENVADVQVIVRRQKITFLADGKPVATKEANEPSNAR